MNVRVGQKAHREMKVTEQVVAAYAEVTGDYNPLHFDPEFAGQTRFKRLIAQGGITTGLLHALVAMDLPGPGTVFINQTWSFPRPVYVGDTILAKATVRSVHESKPVATIDFVVKNQERDDVLLGEATVYQALPTGEA